MVQQLRYPLAPLFRIQRAPSKPKAEALEEATRCSFSLLREDFYFLVRIIFPRRVVDPRNESHAVAANCWCECEISFSLEFV